MYIADIMFIGNSNTTDIDLTINSVDIKITDSSFNTNKNFILCGHSRQSSTTIINNCNLEIINSSFNYLILGGYAEGSSINNVGTISGSITDCNINSLFCGGANAGQRHHICKW